ncbi:MAG: phosphoribosylglycinamide formyltransferase [Oscillospiraceae bacterium]|nr:phosphoribosylglycinamide formyltransferase [Oscillospiraceae bacterium]
MVRAAALSSGDGGRLQAILDSVYFNEIENFELVAVICPQRGCYAMTRSLNAGVPAYVVDPELFPNITSHSMAVANKLKDMDVDLVILADYDLPLGVVPYQFKNRIIGTYPALYPSFHDEEGDPVALALENGLKVTGATAFFADGDGRVGAVILQRSLEIAPDDTVQTLRSRITEDCEWPLLSEAVSLYCDGRLQVRGRRVECRPASEGSAG